MGLAFFFAMFAFAALAVAMQRHYFDLFGLEPTRRQQVVLRAVGALGLAASYGHLCCVGGAVEGTVDWFCLASLAAIVIVVALSLASTSLIFQRRRIFNAQSTEGERQKSFDPRFRG